MSHKKAEEVTYSKEIDDQKITIQDPVIGITRKKFF